MFTLSLSLDAKAEAQVTLFSYVWTSCCFSAVMEYQVQINSIKAKLQETRARKKQQEELIMKVENQALKVSQWKLTQPFRK